MNTDMQETGRKRRWRDNQTAFLYASRKMSALWNLFGKIEQTMFRDELSTLNYNRSMTGLLFGGSWNRGREIQFQPEIGFRWEKRAELLETGPYFALSARLSEFEFNGYQNNALILGELTQFPLRTNSNARINYSLHREFQPGTTDSVAIYLDHLRRDNFFSAPALGRIESLRKMRRGIDNTLRYRLGETAILRMRTSLGLERVTVKRLSGSKTSAERKHDDFLFDNRLALHWGYSTLTGVFEFSTGETIINYTIPDSSGFSPFSSAFASVGYDIQDRTTQIANRIMWRASRRDSFRIHLSLAKSRHENSDARNPDDFDEQRWQFSLFHRHMLRQNLSLHWELSGFMKHFVYIDRSLSAQNNWTRLIQLQPAIRYSPTPRVGFQQKAGIRTQYVAYDFADLQFASSSYVIRDFFIYDSLALQLRSDIQAIAQYRFEIEELGNLNWRRFESVPRTLWRSHWFSLHFQQTLARPVKVTLGVNFYQQTRWRYVREGAGQYGLSREGVESNLGPVLQIAYQARNGSTIYFNGERKRIFPMNGEPYFIDNFQIIAQWTF